MHPKNLKIKDFKYFLPESRIAQFPLTERDQSKLLVYKNDSITESIFGNIDELIDENDLLIFNETKVVHARLIFEKETGSKIEIFCLEPYSVKETAQAFAQKKSVEWVCMVGNAKRWNDETLTKEIHQNGSTFTLSAKKISKTNDSFIILISWDNDLTFAEVIHLAGLLPLPPYMKRKSEEDDEQRYQTVYAKQEGSVAAPTAGLHFTPAVFERLKLKNIDAEFLTLHVGAGTFKPVKSEVMENHEMHEERIYVSIELIEKIISKIGKHKIITVGTTSLRTIESLYWFGVKILNGFDGDEMFVDQWEPYEVGSEKLEVGSALQAIVDWMKKKNISVLSGSTKIIIAPPYEIKIANVLITNFHQPESTLLLLVAAFAGNEWKDFYKYALKNDFRFLSYGDSSILFRN